MTPLSWTPTRNGKIYCAPACGHKCTYTAFTTTTRQASEAALKLGAGWTTHVWENMGWHWAVISPCRRWKIHRHTHGTAYSAFLGDADSSGGYWVEQGNTPIAAMKATWTSATKSSVGSVVE